MKESKQLTIANFNCTFGNEDEPFLNFFEQIVIPAFQSGKAKKTDGAEFFFDNVNVYMLRGIYFLTGFIIKKTELEVRSRYSEEKGIEHTNLRIPSAPYSIFLIALNNHRMILVKNQKGSPSIANFSSTARDILSDYVKEQNRENSAKDKKLPTPHLNVVPIPFKGAINKELVGVKKIHYMKLRFYPLNGDIPVQGLFKELTEQLEILGSKSGNTTINSPKNILQVGEFIRETKGTVEPTLRVEDRFGNKRTLKSDSFTDVLTIELDEENEYSSNLDTIVGKVLNKEEFTEVSEDNERIYQTKMDVIRKFHQSR
ncbi:hypothetical protein [Cohnella laeviribosi]|uniref:hypothetical protein n=1 Tax=Cohnella laeviribosi TaxID=380174 RepID=UPI00035D67A3|nr:hypothetical protein [Cohnella laeviribosi]